MYLEENGLQEENWDADSDERERLRRCLHEAVRSSLATSSDFSEVSALGNFDRDAQAQALAKQAILIELANFTETERAILDFTVCQRSNGSLYGTAGKCRKGKEVSEDQAALQRAVNRKRKTGRYGGTLKKRLANDATHQHLTKQARELGVKRDKAQRTLKRSAEELEGDRWNARKRDAFKRAEQAANAAFTAAERARSALKRRERELSREHQAQNVAARSRATREVPAWADEPKQLR